MNPAPSPRPRLLRFLAPAILLLSASGHCLTAAGPRLGSTLQSSGELLGRFQLVAPDLETFVLRGTLPLPAGIYPVPSGLLPFVVRGPDGNITRAQISVVSRHPKLADGADVVEVLSRVRRPASVPPGAVIRFDVLHSPHPPRPFVATVPVNALVQAGVQLETRDVFGHLYRADVLRDLRQQTSDLRLLRNGSVAHQVRTHEILVPPTPVGGSSGTLPHHVGVHAYFTRWKGEDVVSLDLRIYNGGSGRDPSTVLDDPNERVYFHELVLRVPSDWKVLSAYADPFLGQATVSGAFRRVPLVKALPGGALHMMPMQAQMIRRLVLYREGHFAAARAIAEERTLAFCVDGMTPGGRRLASWWNPETGHYLAQKQPLPRLDHMNLTLLQSKVEENFESLRNTLATGEPSFWPFAIPSPVLGWAHPNGVEVGFMHGGAEITFFPGTDVAWLASTAGYRTFQITHRMYTSRHATALYDANGEATRLEDWLQPGGPTGQWNPTWVWIKPILWLGDPFGFTSAPRFQVDAVEAMGKKPHYEDALLAFHHIFDSHLVRYTRGPKVLAWLGNDALAKDDLRMQAELVRLTYSNFPNATSGAAHAIGMYVTKTHIDQFPGDGAHVDRRQGWHMDTVATAYALAPRTWRKQVEPWCDEIVAMLEEGQDTCTGTLGSNPNLNMFSGQYRTRQAISEAILENGLWGLRQSVYKDRDPAMAARVAGILIRSGYAMVSDLFWDSTTQSAHALVALGPFDFTQPSFCTYVPPGGHQGTDNYQVWPTLAYAYRLTRDGIFLTRAAQMAGGNVPNVLNLGGGYLENAAPVVALFQQLGL